MTLPLGVYAYVGAPQHGKTTLAIREMRELARDHGLVPLIVDSRGAANFASTPHASSVRAVCELVWGQARETVYTPRDQKDLDALLRAVRGAKRCALLIDEISAWKFSGELEALLRTWSHAKTAVLVTSQHVTGDLGQKFLACAPHCRVFRSTAPASIEFWMRWKGIDPDRVRTLKVGEFVEIDL